MDIAATRPRAPAAARAREHRAPAQSSTGSHDASSHQLGHVEEHLAAMERRMTGLEHVLKDAE